MNPENALGLIDKVCGMAQLTRDDHIRVSQAIDYIRQLLSKQNSDD